MLVGSAIFWGSSFIFTKRLLQSATPVCIVFARLLVASIFFAAVSLIFFRKDLKIKRKDLWTLLCFSFFEPFLYFIFETYSLIHCDASVVSIIVATIPIATAFLSLFYFKENFSRLNLIGVFCTFIGIFVLLYPSFADASASVIGVILAFGAVLASVGYTFYLRKYPEHYNPIVTVTYQNLIGLVLFTPLVFILNDTKNIENQMASLFSIPNIYAIILLAIFCSAMAFMFYLQGMRRFGIGKSCIFTNLIPIVTAILSFFILQEDFPLYKILGIIIVIVGIFLVQKKKIPHSNLC